MSDWYVLDDENNPVPVDLLTGAAGLQNTHRHVDKTAVRFPCADISTVFLGLDHGWSGGPPVVFETMIFGGPEDQFQERYCTWAEAESGHKRAVWRARFALFFWLARVPDRIRWWISELTR